MAGEVIARGAAVVPYFPSAGRLLMNKLILSKDPHLVENIESLPLEVRRGVNELEWMFEPKAEDRARIVTAFPRLHRSRISAKVQRDVLPNETLINIFSCLGIREIARVKSISWRWCCSANTTMNRRVGQPTMDLRDLVEAAPFFGCHASANDRFISDISAMSSYCKIRKLIFNGFTSQLEQLESLPLQVRKRIREFYIEYAESTSRALSPLPNLEALSLNATALEVPLILRLSPPLAKITVRHNNLHFIRPADFLLLKQSGLAIDLAGEEISFPALIALAKRVTPDAQELHFGALSSYCPTLRKICTDRLTIKTDRSRIKQVEQLNCVEQLSCLGTLSIDVRSKIDTLEYTVKRTRVGHHAIFQSLVSLFPNLSHVTIKGGWESKQGIPFDNEILLIMANTCKQLKEIYYWNQNEVDLRSRVTSETLERLQRRFQGDLAINLRVFGSYDMLSNYDHGPSTTDIHSLVALAQIYDHSINQFTYYTRHDLSKIVPFLGKITRLRIAFIDWHEGRRKHTTVNGQNSFATLPPSVRNNIGHLLVDSTTQPEQLTQLYAWRKDFFPNAVIQRI